MSKYDEIQASRPNIVVMDRGRMRKEFFPQNHILSEIIKASTTYTYKIEVHNDSLGSMDCKLDKNISLPTGWSYKIKDNAGVEITVFPYGFSIAKNTHENFSLEVTTPVAVSAGELSTIILRVWNTGLDEEYRDTFKILCTPPLLSYTDVQKEIEMLIDDEAIHPSTATYSAEEYTLEVLERESGIVLGLCQASVHGTSLSFLSLAKDIILSKMVARILRKAGSYSLGGEKFYITLSERYDERADKTMQKLMSRCIGEGIQSKSMRTVSTDLSNV